MKNFLNWINQNTQPERPSIFKQNAQISKKYLTVGELLNQVQGIPYYKEVIENYENNNLNCTITNNILEYAKLIYDNPNKLVNLPPIVFIDEEIQDGAHTIAAINLLKEKLDKASPKWHNLKLEVLFGTKTDLN